MQDWVTVIDQQVKAELSFFWSAQEELNLKEKKKIWKKKEEKV